MRWIEPRVECYGCGVPLFEGEEHFCSSCLHLHYACTMAFFAGLYEEAYEDLCAASVVYEEDAYSEGYDNGFREGRKSLE